MSLYVVERRLPNAITADLVMVHEAIVFACKRLTSRGEPIRCLGSAYLPGPGRMLSLFEAETGGPSARSTRTSTLRSSVDLQSQPRLGTATWAGQWSGPRCERSGP